MNHLRVETEDTFASLLELAANNDVEGVKLSIDRDPSCVDEPGLWYGRQKGSKSMVNDLRTPLMVAATYGSIDVIKVILPLTNVNRACGNDKTTALHCAASGGAVNAVQVVKLLLSAGADLDALDGVGQRAGDVIVVPHRLEGVKLMLQELLLSHSPIEFKNVDPSFPDIKNSIYATDEFRMYSFKVRPCSRAYSHDWTECPFVHPGENARRRDPRKYHYSCVPCPDFKKGACFCTRGDMCEYAHGVFESWLHPAQYRTRLCKDGTGCARRVCFFAHTPDELRPLYSAAPSPRSNAGSPSSSVSPFSPSWQQPNVPALHLPGSNVQSSRLRSSLSARDEFNMLSDFEQEQLLNEFSNSLSWSGRMKSLPHSNLDDLFSAEGSSSSPRFADSAVFSPTYKSAVFNHFQQQQQRQQESMLSSPKSMDHSLFSPRNVVEPNSPMSARVSMLAQQQQQRHQFRSLSSRELRTNISSVVGSPVNNNNNSNSWWGSSNGEPDWGMSSEEALGKLRSSSSFDGDEPDVSWVQSLVKETPNEAKEEAENSTFTGQNLKKTTTVEAVTDHAGLEAWIKQMQLDQLVAQHN
ncbi:unnamed protein product [Eruca vesicaria subsp. sativa]|uniref:C3H1-type domain-containing protein n=1 Tax=Eruca vesicaria subsp. sativa TaxID=29727 RepID=A0ABC8LUS6_ERUVS|nr:unnamed protein product [Eruca vesicaria subsp. sativa]